MYLAALRFTAQYKYNTSSIFTTYSLLITTYSLLLANYYLLLTLYCHPGSTFHCTIQVQYKYVAARSCCRLANAII